MALKGNNQDITAPIKKQDKIIRPSEMPAPQQPSGWQFPPKPGYDVEGKDIPTRDMDAFGDTVYGKGLMDADMDADMSQDATNRLGGFGSATASDASGVEPLKIQRPALADKPRGENTPETVESMRMTGCGSDDPFDRFPDRQRSNAPMDADDK